jgi:hypothetical protein
MRVTNEYTIFVPRMKAVALFILCLFFALLNGSEAAHATGHDTLRSYSPAQHLTEQEQAPTLQMRLALLSDRNLQVSGKKESLNVDFDDDDEQEDFIFARKYVLPATYFIILTSFSVLSECFSTVKNRLPFCTHFSYTSANKYILQRVLRI